MEIYFSLNRTLFFTKQCKIKSLSILFTFRTMSENGLLTKNSIYFLGRSSLDVSWLKNKSRPSVQKFPAPYIHRK